MQRTATDYYRRLAAAVFAILLVTSCDKSRPPERRSSIAVPREAFAHPWTSQRTFLLGFGDSVTDGFGASEGRSYFDLLARGSESDPPDIKGISLSSVLPKLKANNLSISGSTSIQALQYQVGKAPAFPEDALGVVVITIGGNDVIHNYGQTAPADGAMYGATLEQARPWIAAFEKRLGSILDGIEKRFPGGCHIFVANIYDPTDGVGDIEHGPLPLPRWKDGLAILNECNAVIERAAAAHGGRVHLVDICTAFLGHGIHCEDSGNPYYHADDPSYWYYGNLEDPNDIGYDAIRRLFLKEMAAVLGAEGEGARR